MRTEAVIDLNECTEFRQTLRASAPALVHATALLSIALVAAAMAWMAWTKANLVVAGGGRVRPISDPQLREDDFSTEISSERDGRVAEVTVDVGDAVTANTVLVRLDTSQLDIQMAKLEENVRAGKDKLQQLQRSDELITLRFQAAQAKAEAELEEAIAELDAAKRRQQADVQLAKIALVQAQDKLERRQNLAGRGVTPQEELHEAESRCREAEANVSKAQLPLNERQVDVARRALELAQCEYDLERQKLALERAGKQDEVNGATFDLARLRKEHEQAVIRASEDCIITKAEVKAGDVVKAGRIGITTARQRGLEFVADVASADVGHLQPEMPVQIKLDAYDYQKYGILAGTVRVVAPDSMLKDLGEGKQAALYNVKITLAADHVRRGGHHGEIKLGMTGQAEIITQRESLLLILVRKMQKRISLG